MGCVADMDLRSYAIEAEMEEKHWWFVGRRKLFAREIFDLAIGKEDAILDVGTSTGTNLRMLRDLGYCNIKGLDESPTAIEFCEKKGFGRVDRGDVCAMPYAEQSFDLVLATDVVEHVDLDGSAVSEIARVLKCGGYTLLTVPAFESLWGLQDEVAHHKRRYIKKGFVRLVAESGLIPLRHYYFNYLLFLPIWAARRLINLLSIGVDSENEIGGPLTNSILRTVFALDVKTARWIKPPFGVSALVIAQKPLASSSG